MRLYEFSKKYNISNKELITQLRAAGFEVQNHMMLLSPEIIAFLEKKYVKKPVAAAPKEEVSKKMSIEPTDRRESSRSEPEVKTSEKIVEKRDILPIEGIVLEPMTVGDFAKQANQPIGEVILNLLRQGIAATKNQLLTKDIIAQLAQAFGVSIVEKQPQKKEIHERLPLEKDDGQGTERLPIVVVVGHVDHGKTTLLDFIRKTRLAAREKGGITQHVGAYEAQTDHGNIVFLDTPGHETFSLMRARGIRVADIAVLVVAADDGVMPQTVEAIKLIQKNELPAVVAINKIDKASPQQVEAVKTRLASYGLTPEEWGGQTVMVPLSAKTGQGVDALLEVLVLQAKLMELSASLDAPARGFVLDAKLEKGRGPVATILCQRGILRVGDRFMCGNITGRVSSLMDSSGNRVDKVLPSQPVKIAGFSSLPHVGDLFEVMSVAEIKERPMLSTVKASLSRHSVEENSFNMIVKTDGASSREALVGALEKLGTKTSRKVNVIYADVGAVKESDINLAADTKSVIYGLHVKVEPNALLLAQRQNVSIKLFDIIYKLLEDISASIELGKPIKMISKKVGEAVVLKVFDIKNIGIVAGAQVKTGRFVKDAKVIVWRGKNKIGEGTITSLQRDKKTVKEVHTGFECAFMVDKFHEWEVDDRVDCYLEIPEA